MHREVKDGLLTLKRGQGWSPYELGGKTSQACLHKKKQLGPQDPQNVRSHCEFPGSWPLKGDLCAESLLGLPWGLMSGGSRLGGGSSWSTEQSQASANPAGSLELESLQSLHPLKQGLQNPPGRGLTPGQVAPLARSHQLTACPAAEEMRSLT